MNDPEISLVRRRTYQSKVETEKQIRWQIINERRVRGAESGEEQEKVCSVEELSKANAREFEISFSEFKRIRHQRPI